jgi:predicted Zn-dependent protease
MAGWSRREVLAALAAGAASAPSWSALLGCGGARSAPAAPPALPRPPAMADLREQLRQVHADLAGRFRAVSVRAEVGRLTRAVVEPEERSFDERGRTSLSLAGFDGTTWFEETAADLGPAAIARATKALAARGGRGGAARAAPESAPPRGPVLRLDPRGRPARDWLDRAARLHERSTRMGSSRIVYRVASLEVDDADVLFLGDGRERSQRLVRARAGALFLAWTGSAITGEEAVRTGAVGLEVTELADAALARAAEDALTLLTSGQIPPGLRDLVLDPSVAALLVREAAHGFEADAWARGARAAGLAGRAPVSAAITLRDDPSAAAYGGYRFDDEGWPGAPTALIERGIVRGPLADAASAAALGRPRTGHGRRAGPLEPVAPRAAHLILSTGARTRDELVAAVGEQGYLVEGGIEGSGDPHAWRVAVRARRAREIAGGRLTGRVYGPVVVAGDVPGLFAAVRGLARDAEVHAWRDSAGGPSSVSAPSLATRGWLGGG